MEEFYQQGDAERALGLPISPFYDRNNKQMAKCQIGFIKFIVRPLYSTFTELATSLRVEILENLNANQTEWERRMELGIEAEVETTPLPTDVAKKALELLVGPVSEVAEKIDVLIEEEEEESDDDRMVGEHSFG